jgi:lipopolysaccharide export system permease protein
MKLIDWYIIKKYLGTFVYSLTLLILVVIVFDISEKIDDFIRNKAPLHAIIFQYYLNFIPYFVNLFIHLFTFIAVVFFTSRMAGNSEIIAMLSSGISFRRLLLPYLVVAVFLGVFSFALRSFLLPHTNHNLRIFTDKYIHKLTKDRERNIHVQLSPGTFAYVESYNAKRYTGYRFALEKFNGERLVYKLNSRKIVRDTVMNKWLIYNYYILKFDTLGNQIIEKGYMKDTTLPLKPTDLYKIKHRYEEMNYFQLNAYIKKEKERGSLSYKQYEVEKYKRYAGPVAILILTVLGMSLTSRKVRGGMGMHLGLGLLLAFSYILLMQISVVFSTQGNLPPSIGVWVPDFVYLFIALYLFRKAPK